LFKALKQNLTVKTFVGTSENALRIQIWTALIALLLLKWLHHLSKAAWSLSNLASMLRLNLFTYRELKQRIDNPMGTPPSSSPWLWYDLDRLRHFNPETSTKIAHRSPSKTRVFRRPRYRSVLSWTAVRPNDSAASNLAARGPSPAAIEADPSAHGSGRAGPPPGGSRNTEGSGNGGNWSIETLLRFLLFGEAGVAALAQTRRVHFGMLITRRKQ